MANLVLAGSCLYLIRSAGLEAQNVKTEANPYPFITQPSALHVTDVQIVLGEWIDGWMNG